MNTLGDISLQEKFVQACEYIKSSVGEFEASQDDQLKLYSFFKQATLGPCAINGGQRPSFFSFEAKYKWDAWNSLNDMSKDDAMHEYVSYVGKLSPEWDSPNKSQLRKDFDIWKKKESLNGGILKECSDWVRNVKLRDNVIEFDADLNLEGNFMPFQVDVNGNYPSDVTYVVHSMTREMSKGSASDLNDFLTALFEKFTKMREEAMELLIALENE